MDETFFSASQLEARTKIYTQYQKELEKTAGLHYMAVYDLKNDLLPQHEQIISTKSAEALSRIKEEENRKRVKIQQKVGQIETLLPYSTLVFLGELHKLKTELKGAQPPCNFGYMSSLAKLKVPVQTDRAMSELHEGLNIAVYENERAYEKAVEQAGPLLKTTSSLRS